MRCGWRPPCRINSGIPRCDFLRHPCNQSSSPRSRATSVSFNLRARSSILRRRPLANHHPSYSRIEESHQLHSAFGDSLKLMSKASSQIRIPISFVALSTIFSGRDTNIKVGVETKDNAVESKQDLIKKLDQGYMETKVINRPRNEQQNMKETVEKQLTWWRTQPHYLALKERLKKLRRGLASLPVGVHLATKAGGSYTLWGDVIFSNRDETAGFFLLCLLERYYLLVMSASDDRRNIHALLSLRNSPGGGKTFFLVLLESLCRLDATALKKLMDSARPRYRQDLQQREHNIPAQVEQDFIEIIQQSLPIYLTFNSLTTFNPKTETDLQQAIAMRLLWDYCGRRGNFEAFVLAVIGALDNNPILINTLNTAIIYYILDSEREEGRVKQGILILVDEVLQLVPRSDDLERLDHLREALQHLSVYLNNHPTVNVLVSTLDATPLDLARTSSFRRIISIPLFFPPVEELIYWYSQTKGARFIEPFIRFLLYDCGGHPRLSNTVLDQWIHYEKSHISWNDARGLGEILRRADYKVWATQIDVSLLVAAVFSIPSNLPRTKLYQRGVFYKIDTGRHDEYIPKLLLILVRQYLEIMISANVEEGYNIRDARGQAAQDLKIPTMSAQKFFLYVLRDLISTDPTHVDDTNSRTYSKKFESFFLHFERLRRSLLELQAKDTFTLREIYALPESVNQQLKNDQIHQKSSEGKPAIHISNDLKSFVIDTPIQLNRKSYIFLSQKPVQYYLQMGMDVYGRRKDELQFRNATEEDYLHCIFISEENEKGCDSIIFERLVSGGSIMIAIENKFSNKDTKTRIANSEVEYKRRLLDETQNTLGHHSNSVFAQLKVTRVILVVVPMRDLNHNVQLEDPKINNTILMNKHYFCQLLGPTLSQKFDFFAKESILQKRDEIFVPQNSIFNKLQ